VFRRLVACDREPGLDADEWRGVADHDRTLEGDEATRVEVDDENLDALLTDHRREVGSDHTDDARGRGREHLDEFHRGLYAAAHGYADDRRRSETVRPDEADQPRR
jgi:hypothetical protein